MVMVLKKPKFIEIFFVISMGIALIHQLDGKVIPNSIKYSVILVWAIIWMIIKRGNIKKKLVNYLVLFSSPYFVFLFISILMYIINYGLVFDKGYLTYLFSHVLYAFFRCFIVVITLDLFRDKAINVLFNALVFSEIVILLYTGYLYGFGNLLLFCLTGVFKAVTNTTIWGTPLWHIGWALEVHDNTFAFGIFLLYFIYAEKKSRVKEILLSIFFVYIGLKRVELFAIGCVVLVNVLLRLLKFSYYSFAKVYSCFYLMMASFFIGLSVCAPEFFSMLDNHRVALYSFLGKQINFSTIIVGKGWGSINYYLQSSINTGLLGTSHSDLVRMFIELGMILGAMWVWYYHVVLPKKLENEIQVRNVGKLCFLCGVFLFVTYFIDNTLEMYALQITYMLVPLCLHKKEQEERAYVF